MTNEALRRIQEAKEQGATELQIQGAWLSSLPPEVGELTELVSLDLGPRTYVTYIGIGQGETDEFEDPNNISKLPPEIGKLANLKRLDLRKNKLIDLPPEIGNLENLEILNLSHNQITELPKEILNIKNLKVLDLRGNKLPIPPEILEKTNEPKVILNFYFQIKRYAPADKEGSDDSPSVIFVKRTGDETAAQPINETKLLLIGQGSVGKTSLVQRILHSTFNPNQLKTEGISIGQWEFEISQEVAARIQIQPFSPMEPSKPLIMVYNSKMRLNIWDFGGQEIMHATHQFFLTKRSLYLLVLDTRLTQDENRVEYWLKIIQSFGGESPVLIVGNKADQHPLDIDRTGLQKKYSNIVGILETSAATGIGIDALKAAITRHAETLPHTRDLLPGTWFIVKSKLEDLAKNNNFFTYDDYLNLCKQNDVTDETSQHTLISFLHDLGVVLHFQDDLRLEQLGILNPQWVTNGVYKILNSHELFQNQGKLTLPILNRVLNLPEYPGNKRMFIVDMMKKFELCYDIEADKSFLIPDLLPKDEAFTGDWNGALAFQYHYNVLPSSIISRFIVRMNPFVHKTVWRSGVVLKNNGNTALVKADTEDRKVYIWVSGNENTRRDFLSAIRMDFEAIHKTIAKIEATEEVPHPNYPDLILDYSELIEFERQGVNEFPKKVGNQVIICNVRELLDGVRPSKKQTTKVFISYAHKDKTFAKKLANELESKGMKAWWDFDSLRGGQDWQKEIERGIKQCEFFLVLLTPDAVASEWVGNEITYANNAQKKIIPLHLKKCDTPISLIKKQYVDFEKQTQKAAIKELIELLKEKA
jgi:internalin A